MLTKEIGWANVTPLMPVIALIKSDIPLVYGTFAASLRKIFKSYD